MKKLIYSILTIALAATMLTGCSGKDKPASTEDNVPSNPATQTTNTTEEQMDVEVKVNEDDFMTESLGDGKCKLTAYHGDSEVVVVPDTIRGETVTEIGGVGTVGIKKVILPDSVEIIRYQAFNYLPDLEEIVFGKGLKEVEYFAFNACDSLETLVFPEGLTTLSELPFGVCANLKEVYIPASVTEFGGLLFYPETMPDLVIVTPAGSDAEKRAQEDGLSVKNP